LESSFSKEGIWTVFRTLLSHPRKKKLVCIIDALDELGNDIEATGAGWLLDHLAGLQQETRFPFSLVISSECYMDIFKPSISLGKLFVIDMDRKMKNSRDVENVFQYQLTELVRKAPLFRGLDNYLSSELDALCAQQRTFLTSSLYFGILAQPRFGLTLNSLSTTIQSLKSNLHCLYDHILACVAENTQYWAYKVLTWITASYRPLKVDELRVVLSIKDGKFQEQFASVRLIDDLIDTFGPLIRIESDEIYFIHPSFKRFIMDVKTEDMYNSRWYKLDIIQAHALIFDTCLAYLSKKNTLSSEDADSQTFEDRIELHTMIPFSSEPMGLLLYASQYWPMHYQRCADLKRAPTSYSAILDFLEKKKRAYVWYRINRILVGHATEASEFSPLIVAAELGLPNLVAELRERVDFGDSDIQKALKIASMNGYADVVEELLNARAKGDGVEMPDMAHLSSPLSMTDSLVGATRMGYKEVVKVLLEAERGKQPTPELHLDRLLSISARKGHLELVKLFLEEGTNVNSIHDALTPLQHAAKAGQSTIVELLLDHPGIDISVGTANPRNSAMHLAAFEGNLTIIRLLLPTAGADAGPKQRGPLHEAARAGHSDVVDLLLKKHPELVNSKDETGMTALHWAALKDHLPVIIRLLEGGARILEKDDCGSIPLIYAASYGNTECLDALLQCLRDSDQSTEDMDSSILAALCSAARGGHAKTVQHLLRHGADAEELYGDDIQQTALHAAAEGGHIDAITALIGKGGAAVDQRSSSGDTPLHCACAHPEAMRLLIDMGANLEATNNNGETPLMRAASIGNGDAVKLLLQNGSDGAAYNWENAYRSPLHYAAGSGSWDCVEPLLNEVWPFRDANGEGLGPHSTALDFAINHGHTSLAQKMVMSLVNTEYWARPIENLVLHCSEDIVKIWLENESTGLNPINGRGTPYLFMLASIGNLRYVELMLAAGTDKDLTDSRGRVALDVAFHPGVRELLDPLSKRDVPDSCQPQKAYKDIDSVYTSGIGCNACGGKIRDGFIHRNYVLFHL
jgi:ankyrin repeat protein